MNHFWTMKTVICLISLSCLILIACVCQSIYLIRAKRNDHTTVVQVVQDGTSNKTVPKGEAHDKSLELLESLIKRPGSVLDLNDNPFKDTLPLNGITMASTIRFNGEMIHRYIYNGKKIVEADGSPQPYDKTPERFPSHVIGAVFGPDGDIYFFRGNQFCKRPLFKYKGPSDCPQWHPNTQLFGCHMPHVKNMPICLDPVIDGVLSEGQDKTKRKKNIFKGTNRWDLHINEDNLTGYLTFDEKLKVKRDISKQEKSPINVSSIASFPTTKPPKEDDDQDVMLGGNHLHPSTKGPSLLNVQDKSGGKVDPKPIAPSNNLNNGQSPVPITSSIYQTSPRSLSPAQTDSPHKTGAIHGNTASTAAPSSAPTTAPTSAPSVSTTSRVLDMMTSLDTQHNKEKIMVPLETKHNKSLGEHALTRSKRSPEEPTTAPESTTAQPSGDNNNGSSDDDEDDDEAYYRKKKKSMPFRFMSSGK